MTLAPPGVRSPGPIRANVRYASTSTLRYTPAVDEPRRPSGSCTNRSFQPATKASTETYQRSSGIIPSRTLAFTRQATRRPKTRPTVPLIGDHRNGGSATLRFPLRWPWASASVASLTAPGRTGRRYWIFAAVPSKKVLQAPSPLRSPSARCSSSAVNTESVRSYYAGQLRHHHCRGALPWRYRYVMSAGHSGTFPRHHR